MSDLLTADEAAAELRCCRTTLYRLCHRKELAQPVQIGGRSFWRKVDIEAANRLDKLKAFYADGLISATEYGAGLKQINDAQTAAIGVAILADLNEDPMNPTAGRCARVVPDRL